MSPLVRHAQGSGSWRVVVPFFATLLSALLSTTLFGLLASLLLGAPVAHAAFAKARLEHPLALTQVDDLPLARDGVAAAATDDALYVSGGGVDGGVTGRLDRYDLARGTWTTVRADLLPRRHHAAVVVGEQLYLFGGRGTHGPVHEVEVVDLASGRARHAAPMPTPRYFVSAALHEGRIYVAGGTLGWGRMDVVEMYDLAADEWYLAPSLGVARDTQLVEAGGALYALGGYVGGKAEVSTVVEKLEGNRWVKVADMPKPTSSFSAAEAGGLVFTFGDHREPDRVLRFDPASLRFTELEVGFFPRRHSAATGRGSRIYVVGGSQKGSPHKLGTVEVFDLGAGEAGAL